MYLEKVNDLKYFLQFNLTQKEAILIRLSNEASKFHYTSFYGFKNKWTNRTTTYELFSHPINPQRIQVYISPIYRRKNVATSVEIFRVIFLV